ncbi:conserved oligomeric Golgi complex subunit 8-like [Daphnia carinata]|uniref:conserved oligomeric Golgi complex subunit 8-like n=1 Tax=Daphnia carinata TaxID=120202 RepID=UPI00257FB9C9|nr:conserved oligomeric Golgi complex subunit 8-like [Daphnia carinata]
MENEDGLLKLVFSGNDLKDLSAKFEQLNLTTIDASQYLKQLNSLGLKKLGNEINRIAEEKTSIINQTQELAFQEYPTFIETAQCTKEIFQNFQKVSQSTEKLTSGLTTLKEKCLEFSQTAQSLSAARRLTSLALSRHTQLLEILELPQLMDTCVRNGYWEEALELASYVARLERKLGYIPLIVKVAQEVQSCTRLMLSQLIAQLRMPAQLPHCLKVVGYLRRMGVFSEEEIRLKFLQARDSWFKSTLEEIPKEDAYQHILKTVELSRVHLFDIATQYRAIFTDEDPLVLANQDPNTNESAIYYSWLIQKITEFLAALQSDLPKVSPSSLESVFGQCMYFGLSFGRIGSDFRSLLVPLFSQVVYDRFVHSANKSEAQFAEAMANFSLTRTNSLGSNASYSYIQSAPSSADQIQPPYSLLKFSPLAELCNGLIAAFNELRICAPVQLVNLVVRKLEQTLRNCSQIVADFHRQEMGAFTANEELEFTKCLQLYRTEFMLYIQKILQIMFSPALISAQTGYTTGEIVKQELCNLNKSFILDPIDHLLTKEESLPELALFTSSSLKLETQTEAKNREDIVRPIDESVTERLLKNGTQDGETLTAEHDQHEAKLETSEPVPEHETHPDIVIESETKTEIEPELRSDPSESHTVQFVIGASEVLTIHPSAENLEPETDAISNQERSSEPEQEAENDREHIVNTTETEPVNTAIIDGPSSSVEVEQEKNEIS